MNRYPSVRLSEYLLPTLRESPSGAESVSHRLMLRSGMIRQSTSGIYTWLPLGYRLLRKIEDIVREEQNRIGCHEMLMPTLQPAELWKQSGRYDNYGRELLRLRDRHDRELLYGPTNEEMLTEIISKEIQSYRQLPLLLYHIQWKFRDELRPRYGVMRGREFLMKDAYSFAYTKEGAEDAYYQMFCAYLRTFSRLGLQSLPMRAGSGNIGGDLSHEFVIIAEKTGESAIYCDRRLLDENLLLGEASEEEIVKRYSEYYAVIDDEYNEEEFKRRVPEKERLLTKGIEVGHIFFFGDLYAKSFAASVSDDKGRSVPLQMGSYGIGVSRLAGALIEVYHDDDGMILPSSVSPFQVGLINANSEDSNCIEKSEEIYRDLGSSLEVIYDDREERGGVKYADADLLGVPWQIRISRQSLSSGEVEIKKRISGEKTRISIDQVQAYLGQ